MVVSIGRYLGTFLDAANQALWQGEPMKPKRWIITSAVLLTGFLCSYAASKSSKGQQFLWQTNSYGDDVHIIDVATQKVVGHVKVGPQPHGIAAPDDAHVVFVAIENFQGPLGELVWIDPKTYKMTHRLAIGPKPNQIDCTPDGRWVYVP